MVTEAMKLKDTAWKKSYDKPRQHIKKQRHHFANKTLNCSTSEKYGQLINVISTTDLIKLSPQRSRSYFKIS